MSVKEKGTQNHKLEEGEHRLYTQLKQFEKEN